MQFESFSDFINMGGYGFYVWLSYGICFALLAALIVSSKLSHQRTIKQLQARTKREQKLRHAAKLHTEQQSQSNIKE